MALLGLRRNVGALRPSLCRADHKVSRENGSDARAAGPWWPSLFLTWVGIVLASHWSYGRGSAGAATGCWYPVENASSGK